MRMQVIVGFTTEGSTDYRFLGSVIQRSFEDLAFECKGSVEILPVQHINGQSGKFVEKAKKHAQEAEKLGVMVLCIHTDADAKTDRDAFTQRIEPAFTAIKKLPGKNACRNLVPIVPVQMTEAWMLSDKDLLKEEIGTNKSDKDLGIDRKPEAYTNPKQVIEGAIGIARAGVSKRRRRDLKIDELYLPLGQKISLEKLKNLPSYKKFREAILIAFRELGIYHE